MIAQEWSACDADLKNGLNISKVTWCRRNLETKNEGVLYPLVFSLSISKHSFQFFTVCHFRAMYWITPNVIWCLCTPMRVVFVKQHGHSLTAVSKYSQVVCCVMSAHAVPSSCFYTNISQSSKDFSSSFWHWSFLSCAYFSLLLIKSCYRKENVFMWWWKLKKGSNWLCIVHRTLVEDDSSEQVTLR